MLCSTVPEPVLLGGFVRIACVCRDTEGNVPVSPGPHFPLGPAPLVGLRRRFPVSLLLLGRVTGVLHSWAL